MSRGMLQLMRLKTRRLVHALRARVLEALPGLEA